MEVGLDVSHHSRISRRGGEMLFPLTSLFIGWAVRSVGRFQSKEISVNFGSLLVIEDKPHIGCTNEV